MDVVDVVEVLEVLEVLEVVEVVEVGRVKNYSTLQADTSVLTLPPHLMTE